MYWCYRIGTAVFKERLNWGPPVYNNNKKEQTKTTDQNQWRYYYDVHSKYPYEYHKYILLTHSKYLNCGYAGVSVPGEAIPK